MKVRKQRQCLRRKSTTSTMIAITMMVPKPINIGGSLKNQAARHAGGLSQAALNALPRCAPAW